MGSGPGARTRTPTAPPEPGNCLPLARVPLGRWAEPDEIAGSFAFLASDDAAYITGQGLCVHGGTVI